MIPGFQIPIDQVKAYLEQLRKQQQEESEANQKTSILGTISHIKLENPPTPDVKVNSARNFENLKGENTIDSQ